MSNCESERSTFERCQLNFDIQTLGEVINFAF